jgi:SAM-dependent methyltransferase
VRRVELYDEPQLYDVLASDAGHDGELYLQLAREADGPVLELACGTGRLLKHLVDGGVEDLTGLDLSDKMLDAARARCPDVTLARGDLRDFDLDRKFAFIFLPLNSLLHMLTTEDVIAALSRVRAHLAEGGRFAFDVFNPNPGFLARDPAHRFLVTHTTDPARDGAPVTVDEMNDYDRARQVQTTQWFYSYEGEPDAIVHSVELRVIFPEELRLLLDVAGLEIEARYGDYRRQRFVSLSPHQVIVARAKEGP